MWPWGMGFKQETTHFSGGDSMPRAGLGRWGTPCRPCLRLFCSLVSSEWTGVPTESSCPSGPSWGAGGRQQVLWDPRSPGHACVPLVAPQRAWLCCFGGQSRGSRRVLSVSTVGHKAGP